MDFEKLKTLVCDEYDKRELESNVRYKALDKVIAFCKEKGYTSLPADKEAFKNDYENYKNGKGEKFSSAESSAINEFYNQYNMLYNK